MEEIAEAAGLSRQTVYAHFPSRDVLIAAVINAERAEGLEAVDAAHLDSLAPVDALRRFLAISWEIVERCPLTLDPILARTPGPDGGDPHRPVTALLERIIRRGQHSGDFGSTLPAGWLAAATIGLGHKAAEQVAASKQSIATAKNILDTSVLTLYGAMTTPASSSQPQSRALLRTSRLRLVPLGDEHLDLEVELDADPEVLRYLDGRARTRHEVQQAHARRMAAGRSVPGLGVWIGFTDERFVGMWMLQPPDGPDQPYGPGEADLGYRLLRRCWRQGFASEGARELVRYGFSELGLERIFAQTLTVNVPSRTTMASIGMTYVRSFPTESPEPSVDGSEQGEVEYAITRQEWLSAPHR